MCVCAAQKHWILLDIQFNREHLMKAPSESYMNAKCANLLCQCELCTHREWRPGPTMPH